MVAINTAGAGLTHNSQPQHVAAHERKGSKHIPRLMQLQRLLINQGVPRRSAIYLDKQVIKLLQNQLPQRGACAGLLCVQNCGCDSCCQ